MDMRGASILHVAAACLLAVSFCAAARAETEEELVQRLRALAPRISSDDPNIRSIEVRGLLAGESAGATLKLSFLAVYQAPDRSALYIFDRHDDVPVMVVADRRMLLYDPIGGRLLIMPMRSAGLMFRVEEDLFRFGFGARAQEEDEREPVILLDLASMLDAEYKLQTESLESATYKLTAITPRSNRTAFVVDIDPDAVPPYREVALFQREAEAPFLSFNRIRVNEELDEDLFRLPSNERLAGIVPIEELAFDGMLSAGRGLALVMRSLYARLAIRLPEMRADMGAVDWDAAIENDRRFAPALKALLDVESAQVTNDQ